MIPTLTYLANSIRVGDRDIPYSTITAIDLARSDGLGHFRGRKTAAWRHRSSTSGPRRICRSASAIRSPSTTTSGKPKGGLRREPPISVWRAIVPIAGAGGRSRSGARVSRHHRLRSPGRLGSAVSDRLESRAPDRRGVLETVSRDAEGVHSDRARAAAVELASWGADRAAAGPAAGNVAARRRASDYEKALRQSSIRWRWDFPCTTCARRVSPRRPARPISASTSPISASSWSSRRCCWRAVLQARRRAAAAGSRLAPGARSRSGGDSPACLSAKALCSRWLGGLVGIAGAIAYSALIMLGLRTWWVDAVGTTALTLHVDPISLVAGALAVVAIAVASIWWSLRALARISTRALLHGAKGVGSRFREQPAKTTPDPFSRRSPPASSRSRCSSAPRSAVVPRVAGFFGAGALSLVAMLCLAAVWLRRGRWGALHGHGLWAVWRLGWRNTAYRPARSVLCIALIAFATFVIVAVEAFKRDEAETLARPPLRRRRLSAAGRDAAADRPRSQRPGRPRCDESAGRAAHCRACASIDFACARRRHELPESVSAEEPAHPRGDAGFHQQRADSRFTARWPNARGARQPMAAAQSRARRRRDSRHHRRELDDLRAAHEARRRPRAAGFVRTPRSACGSSPRCPTASFRASC